MSDHIWILIFPSKHYDVHYLHYHGSSIFLIEIDALENGFGRKFFRMLILKIEQFMDIVLTVNGDAEYVKILSYVKIRKE